MFDKFAEELDSKLFELENKTNETVFKITQLESEKISPIFDYVDTIFVQMKNINNNYNYETYLAIDDIFESVTGKYYMKVWNNGTYHDVNIDKIESVTISNNDSYIVNNWNNIKKQIERKEKIKRLTK